MKYDYNALMKEIYEEVRALGIPVSGNIEPEVQINTRAKKRYGRCMRLQGEKYEYRIEAKTFSGYSSLNRSTTPCHFLLSFEADAERRQICIC